LAFFGQYFQNQGTYTQTFTTLAGCDSTFTLNLTVLPASNSNLTDAICEGDSYSMGPYTFTSEGSYIVNLNSTNGCDSIVNLTLSIIPLPLASFSYTPGYLTVEDNHVFFQDASVQSTSVFYNLGNGQTSSSFNPDAVYPNEGEYTITQIAFNSLGCSDTTSLTLLVNPVSNFFIPNSFTPDNDGINDTWKISMTSIKEYEVRVFDRWGEQLFHSDDLYNYWNGQVNNTGGKVKGDIYVYTIKIVDYLGREKSFRGNVNLVR
jgi:gliding motility-associated-like protein